MSYFFGTESKKNREELEDDLKTIADIAIQFWNCSIIDGARELAEQAKNVAKGVSKTLNSKHLKNKRGKAEAMDIMPYPYNWAKIEKGLNAVKQVDGGMEVLEVYKFKGFLMGIAAAKGIKVRDGTDWNGDNQFEDQTFHDLPHIELVK